MAEFNTDGTLTLVNGRGQFRHKIQSPAESVNAFVNCKILAPVNWIGDAIIDLPSMSIVDKASPPPSSGVTYTISSVRSGNTVNFTVKANPLTSIDPVSVTITEYRPGSPNVIINTRVINVAPVNGIGTTSYTINQTQPSVDQKVEGKITNTPSVKTEVTVPKYVAPPVEDPNKKGRTVLELIPDGRTLGRTGELLCYYRSDGWGDNYVGQPVKAEIRMAGNLVASGSSSIPGITKSTNRIVRYSYSVTGPTTVEFSTTGPAGTGQSATIYIR